MFRHGAGFQGAEHAGQRRGQRDDIIVVRHVQTPVPKGTLTPEHWESTFVETLMTTQDPKDPPGGHGEGERDAWDRERYGSLQDEDREDYGSGWDREGREYGEGQDDEPGASDTETPGQPRAPAT